VLLRQLPDNPLNALNFLLYIFIYQGEKCSNVSAIAHSLPSWLFVNHFMGRGSTGTWACRWEGVGSGAVVEAHNRR
jgi:hypothetical protein